MDRIYADLVFKGLKTLEQVPLKLRDSVKGIAEGLREEQRIREEAEREAAEKAEAERAEAEREQAEREEEESAFLREAVCTEVG